MAQKNADFESKVKRFYKSRKDKMIDGVCGGLADYLGIDATLVRILWLVTVFFQGLGLFAYILAMIIVPVNPEHKDLDPEEKKKRNPALFWGIFLVGMGFLLLSDHWDHHFHWRFPWRFNFLPWWHIPWETYWPLLLVALGIGYIIYVLRKKETKEDSPEEKKPPVPSPGKKLSRTMEGKIAGGVCAGFGQHFNIDPTLIRVGLIILALASNTVFWLIIYGVLCFALPKDESVAIANPTKK